MKVGYWVCAVGFISVLVIPKLVNSQNENVGKACQFLSEVGINDTNNWKELNYKFDGYTHGCLSGYNDIGNNVGFNGLPNNIAYYVNGVKDKVIFYKLVVNINNLQESDKALSDLVQKSAILMEKATKLKMPAVIKDKILKGESSGFVVDEYKIQTIRKNWPNGGYEVHFILS